MRAIQVQIYGKVQGVAFRYYSKLKAEELGLNGTVQNIQDGSVLAIVIGEKNKVDQFVLWCQEGSSASNVTKVNVAQLEVDTIKTYSSFNILR